MVGGESNIVTDGDNDGGHMGSTMVTVGQP